MVYRKQGLGDRLFELAVYSALLFLAALTLFPILQVITISVSPSHLVNRYGLHLFPTEITFDGYKSVLQNNLIWTAYRNTIFTTFFGTLLSLLVLVLGAYPLSKPTLPHRRFWNAFFVFTLYFQGGIVPTFLLVNALGLRNSMLSLILPRLTYAFNLIILRNFFSSLPKELEESAKIDGAGDLRILFQILLPLSKPVLATIALWKGVFQWNMWFDCMIYIEDQSKFLLQYVLRMILIEGQQEHLTSVTTNYVGLETMKMATLVLATLPIICIYPFVQKYFVKGALIGAVKG
jgi:putative aldouronate transport system permease protein